MFYRFYQFFSALFPRITAIEKEYLAVILNNKELNLFNKLQKSDQKHALRIALYLKEKFPQDLVLQKAALLHDIGKVFRPLNVFEKTLTVILDKYFPAYAKKNARYENSIMDIYYNHAQKGAELAKKLQLDAEIIFLIENHHNSKVDNQKLQLLITADNLY